MLLLLLRDELEREDYIVNDDVKEEQKVLVLTKKFRGKLTESKFIGKHN